MTHRAELMTNMLKDGCEFLQADVDTVWMANPFDDIDAAPTKTLVLTDDSKDNTRYLCGCFVYMSPSIVNTECNFLDKWFQLTHELGNEQTALNSVLKDQD